MVAAVSARLTRREGRQFGLTVGIAFLVIGSVVLWRGHLAIAIGALIAGAWLAVAGLLAPTSLGPVQRLWMTFALRMSRVTTPVFLAVAYFGAITPVGLVRRWLGLSPLSRRGPRGTRWVKHAPREDVRASMERLF